MTKKKKNITMDELTKNYESFIKDKEVNKNGRKLFNKALKKATKIKQRGSK